jgi:hypothetical protein
MKLKIKWNFFPKFSIEIISIHYYYLFQTCKYLVLHYAHYKQLFTLFFEKLGLNFHTMLLLFTFKETFEPV